PFTRLHGVVLMINRQGKGLRVYCVYAASRCKSSLIPEQQKTVQTSDSALQNSPARTTPRNPSLASGASIYLLSNILNAALPFALLPILTRYLGPAQYGEVAMFQTFLATLAAFTGLSVQGAAARKYYD